MAESKNIDEWNPYCPNAELDNGLNREERDVKELVRMHQGKCLVFKGGVCDCRYVDVHPEGTLREAYKDDLYCPMKEEPMRDNMKAEDDVVEENALIENLDKEMTKDVQKIELAGAVWPKMKDRKAEDDLVTDIKTVASALVEEETKDVQKIELVGAQWPELDGLVETTLEKYKENLAADNDLTTSHYYDRGGISRIDYSDAKGFNPLEDAVLKYVTRWRHKGCAGKDLDKLVKCAEMLRTRYHRGVIGYEVHDVTVSK